MTVVIDIREIMKNSIFYLALVLLMVSCKKDKVPVPPTTPIVEPTKWGNIAGAYKVYDTIGAFIYDMNIAYIPGKKIGPSNIVDSLCLTNLDDKFNYIQGQQSSYFSPAHHYYYYYIDIGAHQPILDKHNKKWHLFPLGVDNEMIWHNDTIVFHFSIHNILYYIGDAVPYEFSKKKQIAVKQH